MSLSTMVHLLPGGFQLSTFCAIASSSALLLMCKRGKKTKPNAPVKVSVDVEVKPGDAPKDVAKPKSEKKEEAKKAEAEKKSNKEKSKKSEKAAAPKSNSKKEVKEASDKKEKSKKDGSKKDGSKKDGSKKDGSKKEEDKKEPSEKKEEKKELSVKKEKSKSKKEGSKKSEVKDVKADAKDDKKDGEAKDASNLLDADKKSVEKDGKKEEDKKTDDKGSNKEGSKKESSKKDVDKKDGDEELKEGSKMDVQKTQMTVIPAILPKEVIIDPKELRFTSAGGMVKLNLTNSTGARVAVKIKCSDNDLYRINPVFTLIEKDAKFTVEVSRVTGTAKPDKLAVVHTEAADDAKDAQVVFKAAPSTVETISIPMFVS